MAEQRERARYVQVREEKLGLGDKTNPSSVFPLVWPKKVRLHGTNLQQRLMICLENQCFLMHG